MTNRHGLGFLASVLASCAAGPALAQDAGLAVSVGARAWNTEWTTFTYFTQADGTGKQVNKALVQSSAGDRFVLIPTLSVRYGPWLGAFSLFPATGFSFANGDAGTRKEFDLNLGYTVLPGLNLTLGYKKVSQRSGGFRYEPSGLVLGANATAPLSDGLSLYGSFGLGRLKTPMTGGDEVVKFKASYRLTEVGLAYALDAYPWPRRWTFTGGYRMQVMGSKEAFGTQDGRDTTQGFTFGAIATF